jgi:serine/threonine protein kinase
VTKLQRVIRTPAADLAERLCHYQDDLQAAARFLATTARAVHHAHQHGVIQRDLQPSNILLQQFDDGQVADERIQLTEVIAPQLCPHLGHWPPL